MARLSSLPLVGLAAWSLIGAAPEGSTPHAHAQGFDHAGDPLPAGATMRLGTTRLRQRQGVNGVAFSPDGKNLVSMGWGDSIRFWDATTGRQVRRLKTPGVTFAAAFSPDGSLLASVGGNLRLWDLATGEQLYEKEIDANRTYSVAFSPDERKLAAAGMDEIVRVWETKSGDLLRQLPTEGGSDAHPVAFSPDGRLLASGSKTGTIRIWNLADQAPPIIINKAHGREIVSLAFTADSSALISGGHRYERPDGELRSVSEIYLWNVADGSRIHEFRNPLDTLSGGACLALSADGSTLVSSHYQWIVAWDMTSREAARVIPREESSFSGGRSHGLAISPDSRLVASIANEHKVELWNIETGERVFPQQDSHHGGVLSIDTSPDGNLIVTGGEEGDVHLWDALSGQHIRKLSDQEGWVRSVRFMPDGERIVMAGETRRPNVSGIIGAMKVIRLRDGVVAREWPLPDRGMCTALSSEGTRLAVGLGVLGPFLEKNRPLEIRVYDFAADQELPVMKGHDGEIQQLCFGEDRATLWSTSVDGTIRKWNVESGEEIDKLSLEGGDGRSQKVSVSNDLKHAAYGNYIYKLPPEVSVGQIAVVGLDDEQSGWHQTLAAHLPYAFEFSPNNEILAVSLRAISAVGEDHRITLFDAATGREVLSFELEDGVVRSLAFSPDGRTLYSGMDRGDILVWDVSRAYE